MTDRKIIELGVDIGDGRIIAVEAELIFSVAPVPVLTRDPDEAFSPKRIGSATHARVVGKQLRADITLDPDEDEDDYTYLPEFGAQTEWEAIGSDRDGRPRGMALVRGDLRALYAVPVSPSSR